MITKIHLLTETNIGRRRCCVGLRFVRVLQIEFIFYFSANGQVTRMREDFHQEQGALFGAAPAGAMMKKRAAHQERHDDFIPEVTVTKVSTLSYEP